MITENPHIQNFIIKGNFADAAKMLLSIQRKNWKQLSDGYESLKEIKTRDFHYDSFNLQMQFNPKRIKSTSAKIDRESIKKRRCFLCIENLPEEQEGIFYNDEYLILCNPFPIFPEHFTIVHKDHIPQSIKGSFDSFLLLARDLSKYYTVFYNGPECGASAPDHLHFQACTKYFMPIDSEFNRIKKKYGSVLINKNNIAVTSYYDGLRKFLTFESGDLEILKKIFNAFYKIYSAVSDASKEPMMNILTFFKEKTGWRIIIFLREKHRPSFFYSEDEERILWSPAAADLGGICVLPLEKDFDKISKELVSKGLNEITLSEEKFSFIKNELSKI